MKNLAEFYNLKCEKSVQPMGSTSLYIINTVFIAQKINQYYRLDVKVVFLVTVERLSHLVLYDFFIYT